MSKKSDITSEDVYHLRQVMAIISAFLFTSVDYKEK